MTEARRPFIVHCGACGHEWAIGFLPMPLGTAAKVMRAPCPACHNKQVYLGERPKPTAEGQLAAWLTNGDTGLSSLTIWHVLAPGTLAEGYGPSVPRDPSDFGRCYRLLKVMPAWRARLGEVADQYPAWRGIVDAWDELTALYEAEEPTGSAPRLYARMQALHGAE